MKLLAKYDPISHLKFAAENPRSVNYMSNNIQNEFIHIVASEVRRVLIEEIKESKYYGMMYDETPDKAKREQMLQVLRYVHIDWDAKTVKIKESFLGFIESFGKDAVSIVNVITSQLEKDGIPLADCRSQCCDNVGARVRCTKTNTG